MACYETHVFAVVIYSSHVLFSKMACYETHVFAVVIYSSLVLFFQYGIQWNACFRLCHHMELMVQLV